MWRNKMKYKSLIGTNTEVEDILDILNELFVPESNNRLDYMLKLIRFGIDNGLINISEKMKIQRYLIDGPGGM